MLPFYPYKKAKKLRSANERGFFWHLWIVVCFSKKSKQNVNEKCGNSKTYGHTPAVACSSKSSILT
jgi:hypothetical protein